MRLTTNGVIFLGAGAAAFGCAYFMNIPPLRSVGALLVVLPLVSLLTVLGSGRALRVLHVRFDCPEGRSTPEEGVSSPLRFAVVNQGAGTSVPQSLRIAAAEPLGVASTVPIPQLAPGESAEFTVPCRPRTRGKHVLGPLTADRHGILGLSRRTTTALPETKIPVGPRMFDVPRLTGESGDDAGREAHSVRRGFDVRDFTTRAYERGDDIRFVHWASTARHGELMVRHESGSDTPSAIVVLDTYEASYPRRKYFEWAACAAAGASWSLLRAGYVVDVFTQAGAGARLSPTASPSGMRDQCLDAFAGVELAGSPAAPGATAAGVVVAVAGSSTRSAARLCELAARADARRLALCQNAELLGPFADHRFAVITADPRSDSVVDAWTRLARGRAFAADRATP